MSVPQVYPAVICINLPRAGTRRARIIADWTPLLGGRLQFHEAVDRRDVAERRIRPPATPARSMSSGEIACLMSHLGALATHAPAVGDEGIILMEDDIRPLDGAERLDAKLALARSQAPDVDAILLCRPVRAYGMIRQTALLDIAGAPPPHGATMVWFSRRGADAYITEKGKFRSPADHWKFLCRQLRFGVMRRPVAMHLGLDSYIGNCRAYRKFIP